LRPAHRGILGLVALALAPACAPRETPEAARARAQKAFLEKQIESLTALRAKAERGELVTTDQIAIGIQEKVVNDLLNAPLPQEMVVGGKLRLKVEKTTAYFRGNQTALVFRARASAVDAPSVYATVELAGTLDAFKLKDGHLSARVKILHFAVLESAADALAGLAEHVVRGQLPAIEEKLPPLELPVSLEPNIRLESTRMGPVTVQAGQLPLEISVAQVLTANERLWILLEASAGPWASLPAKGTP
jgi:hypothetical protein